MFYLQVFHDVACVTTVLHMLHLLAFSLSLLEWDQNPLIDTYVTSAMWCSHLRMVKMMSDSILLAFNSEGGLAVVPFVLKLIVVLTQLGTSSKDHRYSVSFPGCDIKPPLLAFTSVKTSPCERHLDCVSCVTRNQADQIQDHTGTGGAAGGGISALGPWYPN